MIRFNNLSKATYPQTKNGRVRVLILGMANSVHLARWITQFESDPIDFILIPSTRVNQAHALIRHAEANWAQPGATLIVQKSAFWKSRFIYFLDQALGQKLRGRALAAILAKGEFDFIHLVEFQHAGYLYLASGADRSTTNASVISTNYGSDIFWFQRFPVHARKITRLLQISDRYSAECSRDVQLARNMGFKGTVLPIIPNAGGFADQAPSSSMAPTSERKKIVLKGYDTWVGKASLGLDALEIMARELSGFTIAIYSCGNKLRRRAAKVAKKTGLTIETYGPGALDHNQMLQLFSESRLYLGISMSDGISTSMLEALIMGCFPLQTSSACVDEWFETGKDGIALSSLAPADIAKNIREALYLTETNSPLENLSSRERVRSKLDTKEIYEKAKLYYQKVESI